MIAEEKYAPRTGAPSIISNFVTTSVSLYRFGPKNPEDSHTLTKAKARKKQRKKKARVAHQQWNNTKRGKNETAVFFFWGRTFWAQWTQEEGPTRTNHTLRVMWKLIDKRAHVAKVENDLLQFVDCCDSVGQWNFLCVHTTYMSTHEYAFSQHVVLTLKQLIAWSVTFCGPNLFSNHISGKLEDLGYQAQGCQIAHIPEQFVLGSCSSAPALFNCVFFSATFSLFFFFDHFLGNFLCISHGQALKRF